MTSNISNSKKDVKSKSKDKTMQNIINYGTVVLILIIAYVIYKKFIERSYYRIRGEGFEDFEKIEEFANTSTYVDTLYEKAIKNIYESNTRLKCSMIPTLLDNPKVCVVNNEPFVPYNFPIHIIKLINGTILAVFNDGRLYKKDSILSSMWTGPITNSKPNNVIPLRMISLKTDLVTLLGVGYDNILYMKKPNNLGNIDLVAPWVQVPNNSNIIYVLFDNETNFLLSIDTKGQLFTKSSLDIATANRPLTTKLDRPILRLYYDLNGYMLAIDDKFDLYQFSDIKWKISTLSLSRGANNSKIQDLLYDNDGKMYGLVFNPESFMVQIMKQSSTFYLSNFTELNLQITSEESSNFVMSDQDVIICKIGSIHEYLVITNASDANDDDPNFAYHKQLIENTEQLRQFCANKNSITGETSNYDNYDTLSSVDKNKNKISKLKSVINNLLSYEADSSQIKEKYPIIST